MRFSSAIFAAVALASSAFAVDPTAGFAVMTTPSQDQNLVAGSSFDLIWTPGTETGTLTITLLQGATFNTLDFGPVLASKISNSGKFTYSVPTTSSFATYGFKIASDANPDIFQFSRPFHITGASSSSSSVSGSVTAGSTSTGSYISTASASATITASSATLANTTTLAKSKTAVYNSTTSAIPTTAASTGYSNSTILTTVVTPTATGGASATSKASGTSTSAPATATSNAANVLKTATGGFAVLGGMVLAFAL